MVVSNSPYSTSDTALAAWLYSSGRELLQVDTSQPSVLFVFGNGNSRMSGLLIDYQTGQAEGNILAFFRAYKMLIGRIKENGKY